MTRTNIHSYTTKKKYLPSMSKETLLAFRAAGLSIKLICKVKGGCIVRVGGPA